MVYMYIVNAKGEKFYFKGCLFDFDGVVVDTETYHFRSWNYGGAYFNSQLTWEEYLPLKSTGTVPIATKILEKAGIFPQKEYIDIIGKRKSENFDLLIQALSKEDIIPGVETFLIQLKSRNISTAMASSSHTSISIAEKFGLAQYFDTMFDGNTKMPRKPAPDVFLTASAAISVSPSDCIVFEDSLAGIDAAINAGMQVIAVGGIRSEKAIAHIMDFTHIHDLFVFA